MHEGQPTSLRSSLADTAWTNRGSPSKSTRQVEFQFVEFQFKTKQFKFHSIEYPAPRLVYYSCTIFVCFVKTQSSDANTPPHHGTRVTSDLSDAKFSISPDGNRGIGTASRP